MKTAGQAGTNTDVIDDSILITGGLKGIIGIMGITERGKENTPRLIGSWTEYKNYYGDLITQSNFPLYAKRFFESGGRAYVSRVNHYTTVADKTTLQGTKATLVKNQSSPVTGVAATGVITITGAGTAGNTITVRIDTGAGVIELGTGIVPSSPTVTTSAAAVKAAINVATPIHGWSADNVAGVLTVTAPISLGAVANAYTLGVVASGTVAVTVTTPLASGVTALSVNVFTATAESVGTWANSLLWMQSVPAANGAANEYDVSAGLTGYDTLTIKFSNFPTSPTTNDIAAFNAKFRLIQLTGATTIKDFSLTYFGSGVEDKTIISNIDHIGDASQGIGISAFDSIKSITKIAIFDKAVPMIDAALANYAFPTRKGDLVALLRTPIGLDDSGITDYREGTGSYSHAAIDNPYAWMYTGGLQITHPYTGVAMDISEIADVAAAFCRKATNVNEWFAVGGSQRGVISNALGVVYDLGTAARGTAADSVSIHGVNAIIDHESFGIVIWDNVTLQKADTLLKFANVVELLVYLRRGLKPLVESELFNPNDVDTWKAIYRKVKYFMEPLKTNRAVWDYLYEGDQNIDDVSQATVNEPSNIDAGAYKFRLFVKPKVGLKFIQIDVIVKNSTADFTVIG